MGENDRKSGGRCRMRGCEQPDAAWPCWCMCVKCKKMCLAKMAATLCDRVLQKSDFGAFRPENENMERGWLVNYIFFKVLPDLELEYNGKH